MKIAHIITRMIVGGAQENTLYTCLDLARQYGDDVLLITGPALGPEGDLLTRMAGAGEVRTVYVDALRRAIHPWRDAQAYFAIRKLLQEFQPDVVHTHSAKGGILGRLAAHALQVPAIVHTVHGAPFHPYQNPAARWFYQACEPYAARRCHKLVSVADAMTDLMVSAKIAPREKFVTIYSGMEVEPFLQSHGHRARMRVELGFRDEHVVIGKIARLFELKGHEYVIAAAKELVARQPQVRFLFVGDGKLREQYQQEIAAAGLTEQFVFTGLVPPVRIPEYLSAMDLLVHCSLREGLARALPQALLSGKPVVSFDIDGAREVVINDVTGFLLPPCELPPLVAALEQLVSDPALRERLGAAGRQRYEQPFRHEVMTSQLHTLYTQLLAR
ncbi:MAG TPA: glycosyltransferase family 4 protein [Pirellulaceae bacterium]|nr:glycosyltransferase family 4 protein [Pirellulaceae bacterium]